MIPDVIDIDGIFFVFFFEAADDGHDIVLRFLFRDDDLIILGFHLNFAMVFETNSLADFDGNVELPVEGNGGGGSYICVAHSNEYIITMRGGCHCLGCDDDLKIEIDVHL